MGTGPLGRSSIPGKRGQTWKVAVAEACRAVFRANGDMRGFPIRLPTADSLCSLKVARASKISGRKFSAAARQNPARLNVCRNGCAERQRGGAHWIFPRRAPFGRKESQPWAGVPPDAVCPRLPERPHGTPPPPRSAASFTLPSYRACPRMWKRSQDPVFWFLLRPWSRALFSQQRQMGPSHACQHAGTCGAGGRAFRGLTRSATEWSAARRKPLRAAALHFSAAISADVKARRLPTSDRRKFPSGDFRSARDLEGAERVNPRKARLRPSPSPFASNRGMSPLFRGFVSRRARQAQHRDAFLARFLVRHRQRADLAVLHEAPLRRIHPVADGLRPQS